MRTATRADAPPLWSTAPVLRPERPVAAPNGTGRSFAVAVVALAATTAIAVSIGHALPPADLATPALAVGTSAVALSGAAGALMVGRSRLLREHVSLLLGVMLLLLSLGWMLPRLVLAAAGRTGAFSAASLGAGAAIGVLVLSIFVAQRPRRRRGRMAVAWTGGTLASTALASVAAAHLTAMDTWLVTDAALAFSSDLSLGLAAATVLVLGHRRQRAMLSFTGLGLLGVVVAGSAADAASRPGDPNLFGASLLGLAASAVLLMGVTVDLQQTYTASQERLLRLWHDAHRDRGDVGHHYELLHDLRNGLLSIEMAVAALGRDDATADLGRLLGAEVVRLRTLAASHGGVRAEPIDVVGVVRPLVELRLRRGVAATLDGAAPLLAEADAAKVAEIVQNLLGNAERHAPLSPITVSVTTVGPTVEIRVTDRGAGVPPHLVDRIFDRHFTTHPEGSGLGLDLARRLARQQGGDLWFERPVGGGSRFVVALPAAGSA